VGLEWTRRSVSKQERLMALVTVFFRRRLIIWDIMTCSEKVSRPKLFMTSVCILLQTQLLCVWMRRRSVSMCVWAVSGAYSTVMPLSTLNQFKSYFICSSMNVLTAFYCIRPPPPRIGVSPIWNILSVRRTAILSRGKERQIQWQSIELGHDHFHILFSLIPFNAV
jgi:hypothetical protein